MWLMNYTSRGVLTPNVTIYNNNYYNKVIIRVHKFVQGLHCILTCCDVFERATIVVQLLNQTIQPLPKRFHLTLSDWCVSKNNLADVLSV